MNKNFAKLTVAAIAVATFGTSAAHAASTTGTATAKVIPAVGITESTQLNFGSVTASASSGTVVIDQATNAVTSTGGTTVLSGSGATRGVFALTGDPNRAYNVTVDATATLTSGANSMTATLTNSGNGTFSAGGTGTLNVGGSLAVSANQATGTYTGTYNVSVNY